MAQSAEPPVDGGLGLVMDPRELLARRLIQQVDQLLPLLDVQPAGRREWFLDQLTGLSLAAEALLAIARNDPIWCEDHIVAALRLLDTVEPEEWAGPESSWD